MVNPTPRRVLPWRRRDEAAKLKARLRAVVLQSLLSEGEVWALENQRAAEKNSRREWYRTLAAGGFASRPMDAPAPLKVGVMESLQEAVASLTRHVQALRADLKVFGSSTTDLLMGLKRDAQSPLDETDAAGRLEAQVEPISLNALGQPVGTPGAIP